MIKRIAIIGSPGSGKTTLARKLGKKLTLPVFHLDHHFWEENWQGKDKVRWGEIVKELAALEEWIIDGDYFNTMETRLNAADMIIYLNLPKWLCLWRIYKRMLFSYGKVRSDMPEGCKEKLNWQFISFVKFVWDYHKIKKPLILKMLEKHGDDKKICILHNDNDIENLYKRVLKLEG
jgi:adenylate kinase family enzyme